jgi:hypothetical protein
MKTYGNHYRVEDPNNRLLQTFDSGIASVFEQQTIDARGIFVQYVGVLKDILKLNYDPIVIFRCEWMK